MSDDRKFYPITNKYTFAGVFRHERLVRPLLEAVLQAPVLQIRYVETEHSIEPSLRGRGVRMDVTVEDDHNTVYDVEMQNVNEGDLALRSRYYLSSLDRDRLAKGKDFRQLGRTVVIFVCAFDLFGLGGRVYEVRPCALRHGTVLDDGTVRYFLNTKGAAGEAEKGNEGSPADDLHAFMTYVDGGGTMGNKWVEDVDREVQALNADEGWREAMIGYEVDLMDAARAGRMEGRAEGRAEGQSKTLDANRRLAEALRAVGRESEFVDAGLDEAVRARLMAEFGIDDGLGDAPAE